MTPQRRASRDAAKKSSPRRVGPTRRQGSAAEPVKLWPNRIKARPCRSDPQARRRHGATVLGDGVPRPVAV